MSLVVLDPGTKKEEKIKEPKKWRVVLENRAGLIAPCIGCALREAFKLSSDKAESITLASAERGEADVMVSTQDVAIQKAEDGNQVLDTKGRTCILSGYRNVVHFVAKPV